MKNTIQNNQGFSIIMAIFMVGFLLVLTTGVFNLVLKEMNSNRGGEKYLKAYAGAEGAMELGLLEIKKNGYGFDKDVTFTQSGSEVLSFNSSFNPSTDPKISYNMAIKTNNYNGELGQGETNIIPLFWLEEGDSGSAKNIALTLGSGNNSDLIWNIIGAGEGMSGIGALSGNDIIQYRDKDGDFQNSTSIVQFLSKTHNAQSYLMLYNKSTSNDISYEIKTNPDTQFFSKPIGNLTSSVKIGKYKQNISTEINNTEFLNMLKYSIYAQ